MSLTRCHFCHRADLIANGWFDVGPTSIAQQAMHMATYCQPFYFKYRVGPTLARQDLLGPSININSLELFGFPYTWCYWLE